MFPGAGRTKRIRHRSRTGFGIGASREIAWAAGEGCGSQPGPVHNGVEPLNAVASDQKMMLMLATDVSAIVQGYSGSSGGGQYAYRSLNVPPSSSDRRKSSTREVFGESNRSNRST